MGSLIVLEGIEGSGKSTQFKLLCDRFLKEGRDFMRISFPRYDKPSSALIKMYLGGELGNNPNAVNAYAASTFFAVDRFASFLQDWRHYYESGGMILTDRYTTSNAIHQGAKLSRESRKHFFTWLYEFEFSLLGLPQPDMVIHLHIDAELSHKRLTTRQTATGTDGDIHEMDLDYLKRCAHCGKQAADFYDWHTVNCVTNGRELNTCQLHDIIYGVIDTHFQLMDNDDLAS